MQVDCNQTDAVLHTTDAILGQNRQLQLQRLSANHQGQRGQSNRTRYCCRAVLMATMIKEHHEYTIAFCERLKPLGQ